MGVKLAEPVKIANMDHSIIVILLWNGKSGELNWKYSVP